MDLFIFARFHAGLGKGALAEALRDVLAPSSEEPGCLGIPCDLSRGSSR